MTTYKAKYETRKLYTQKYVTEDEVAVSSTTYAVMWSLSDDDIVTSRLRITLLFKQENTVISPVQGLVEQWKGEGWTPMDEFADAELVFDTQEDFEEHMCRIARSFILGIPLNSDLSDNDDTPEDPVNTRTFDTKDKRFSKSTKIANISPVKLTGKNDILPEQEEAKNTNENQKSDDDSDDDEWL